MTDVNSRVRAVGVGAAVLVIVLFVQLNYLQVFDATSLDNNPHNTRDIIAEFVQPRGAIISADGVTLAQSLPTKDQYKYQRVYPEGALFGQVTGYFSLTYGTDGLEDEYNSVLTDTNNSLTVPGNVSELKKFFTAQPSPDNLQLTVLSSLQELAAKELAGRAGAVVALVPKTGAVLAMYSNPSYDPGPLASHNQTVEQTAWDALNSNPGKPLLAAAYRQRFFPGSTFKVITAAAVYDHRPALANRYYPVTAGFVLPDTADQVLHNFAGETCGGEMLALFTVSCDTGFAQLGLGVGAAGLVDEANAFGWDQTPPLDLPGVARVVVPTGFVVPRQPCGPGQVRHRPGERPSHTPYSCHGRWRCCKWGFDHDAAPTRLCHRPQGQTVRSYRPKPWLTATSPATAGKLTKLMLSVVNSPNGTGVAARIPGIQVAGKTGTAQTGLGYIETWFVSFAPVPNPRIAVAVLVEDQPPADDYVGGTIAAPIARAVIQAYLQPGSD